MHFTIKVMATKSQQFWQQQYFLHLVYYASYMSQKKLYGILLTLTILSCRTVCINLSTDNWKQAAI